MAEVLASLKKIGGNGEQYTETSLWTNPDPTSSFASQNVTLSDAITNYKYIGFKWKAGTSSATYSTMLTLVTDFMRATGADQENDCTIACKWTNDYIRRIEYLSPTSIAITGSYRLNATGNNNGVNIPLEILGINELAHQTVGERYDVLPATAFKGTAPTFTTKGRPKAVWMSFKRETVSEMSVVTNVNPYTGEAEQGKTYRSEQGSTVIEDLGSENPFIITDNSVGFTTSISGAKVIVICSYTY